MSVCVAVFAAPTGHVSVRGRPGTKIKRIAKTLTLTKGWGGHGGLDHRSIARCDQRMELTKEQRRAILAMCCTVARSDGQVSSSEYESLLDLLSRMAHGAVGFSELQHWMDHGPPEITVRLPEHSIRMFLREALGLARADGKLEQVELATIKELVARYFDTPTS